jgi:hypothetical protein
MQRPDMNRWARRLATIFALLGLTAMVVAGFPSVIHGSDPAAAARPPLRRMPAEDGSLLKLVAPLHGGRSPDGRRGRRDGRPSPPPAVPACRAFVPGTAEQVPIPTHFAPHELRVRAAPARGRGESTPRSPRSECVGAGGR